MKEAGLGGCFKMPDSNASMKIRKHWLVLLAVSAVVVAVDYMASSRRDLEVALKVDRLPWSLRNEEVRIDSWTDYSVDGYFEVDPEDLRQFLTRRPYVETPLRQGFWVPPTPSFDFFPHLEPFEVEHLFEWEVEEPFAYCRIWTNADFTKAFVSYAVD